MQVSRRTAPERDKKEVNVVFAAIKNRVRQAFLTPIDCVIMPRVEVAVKSITGFSRRMPNRVGQNPKHADCWGNTENTPLLMASNRKVGLMRLEIKKLLRRAIYWLADLTLTGKRTIITRITHVNPRDHFPLLFGNIHG